MQAQLLIPHSAPIADMANILELVGYFEKVFSNWKQHAVRTLTALTSLQ